MSMRVPIKGCRVVHVEFFLDAILRREYLAHDFN